MKSLSPKPTSAITLALLATAVLFIAAVVIFSLRRGASYSAKSEAIIKQHGNSVTNAFFRTRNRGYLRTLLPVPIDDTSTPFSPLALGDESNPRSPETITKVGGKVILKGVPPKELEIDPKLIAIDRICGQFASTPKTTRHFVVDSNGGLANVLVYVSDGINGQHFPPDPNVPVIDTSECIFEPYVLAVRTNQKFLIRNPRHAHYIVGRPKAPGNAEFNFPIPQDVYALSFPMQELMIRIQCAVHPWWMSAYVSIIDHPFFAVSEKDGSYSFPSNLPAGEYTIEAYHLKAGIVKRQVTVSTGKGENVDFIFDVTHASPF